MLNSRNAHLAPLSPGRAMRRDSLPEYKPYVDTGCHVHPSCLTCPLAHCLHDAPVDPAHAASISRARVLQSLRDSGLTIDQVAQSAGVSRRTVFRLSHAPV